MGLGGRVQKDVQRGTRGEASVGNAGVGTEVGAEDHKSGYVCLSDFLLCYQRCLGDIAQWQQRLMAVLAACSENDCCLQCPL